jgi:hypothetical protein
MNDVETPQNSIVKTVDNKEVVQNVNALIQQYIDDKTDHPFIV